MTATDSTGLRDEIKPVGVRAPHDERFPDDDAMLEAEMPMYDALYEFCRTLVEV